LSEASGFTAAAPPNLGDEACCMFPLAEQRGWRWIQGQSVAKRLYRRANE